MSIVGCLILDVDVRSTAKTRNILITITQQHPLSYLSTEKAHIISTTKLVQVMEPRVSPCRSLLRYSRGVTW